MTSLLSKIKNIGEHDFSANLNDRMLRLDDLARYGIHGVVTCLAFDPVQSLLVVGTDQGAVYVIGQQNVLVEFDMESPDPIKHLRFIRGAYLVVIDSRSTVSVIDMEPKEIIYKYRPISAITCVESDPSLDWLFLGLTSGQIAIFDVDRGIQAPFRIGNLLRSVNSRAKMSPVVSLALHPRDASTLLVAFHEYTVCFSLAKSEILFSLFYKLPAGALGGDLDPMTTNKDRVPRVISAQWHPNGHHILTAHNDGSLVFWDGNDGTMLQARTLIDTDVNVVRRQMPLGSKPLKREPIRGIAWCCTQNPEETSILISGGDIDEGTVKGMTMLDFGQTPQPSITSYQAMGQFYAQPKRHKIYPLPENVHVDQFIMLTKDAMPYYGGNFNPSYTLCLLNSGELLLMKFPEGYIVTDPTVLPACLGWINPYVTALGCSLVPRTQWIGIMSTAQSRTNLVFKGGAPARRHLRTFQSRCALCTGHSDGTVKIWDASHGELTDATVLEMNMSSALLRHHDVYVTHVSMAGPVAEVAVAALNGDVVLFTFGVRSKSLNSAMSKMKLDPNPPKIEDIQHRAPADVKEGFLPKVLVHSTDGPVTALCNSNIGFAAVGYENGALLVIDRRINQSILSLKLNELSSGSKKRFSRRGPSTMSSSDEYVTALQFSIYAIGEDNYSSIILSVGSSVGTLYTFKILPNRQGSYDVQFVDSFAVGEGPVISLNPINIEKGNSAVAEAETFAQLSRGILIHGAIIVVTSNEARVIRQPNTKLSHKKFNFTCLSAGYATAREGEDNASALVCIGNDNILHNMAVPSLRDLKSEKLPYTLASAYAKDNIVAPTGDVILRPSKTFGALVNICGRGSQFKDNALDDLYDPLKELPPRPTISTVQWVKGRQYMTSEDLDLLIGGPRRPKARRPTESDQARREQDRNIYKGRPGNDSQTSFASSSRQGKTMDNISDTFNNIGQGANEYLNGLTEMVNDSTKNVQQASFTGLLKAKFL